MARSNRVVNFLQNRRPKGVCVLDLVIKGTVKMTLTMLGSLPSSLLPQSVLQPLMQSLPRAPGLEALFVPTK